MRRFLDHVLPKGFVKIRHYGLLASGNVASRLSRARALLSPGDADDFDSETPTDDEIDWPALLLELTGIDLRLCPRCQRPTLRRLPLTPPLHPARAPPRHQQDAA